MNVTAKIVPALWLAALTGMIFTAHVYAVSQTPEPQAKEAAPAQRTESFGNTEVILTEPVRSMFSHKSHVVTAGITCDRCHPNLFERKRGAAKANGDYNMASLDSGKYCGACHDGKAAFSTTGPTTCKVCHGSDMKQPDMIVFNRPVKAVVFNHKGHVDMGLSCASCHDKAFEMRKGAAEESPEKFNMQALYAGKYCGVCHNGHIAYASDTRCTSCHIGVKGLAKMLNAPKDNGEKGQHE